MEEDFPQNFPFKMNVLILTAFQIFLTPSQFWCMKATAALFCSENESHESLSAFILSHHFLLSLLSGCLATECLTQHTLNLKQQTCGFYALIFQHSCRSQLTAGLFPSHRPTGLRMDEIYSRKLPEEVPESQNLRVSSKLITLKGKCYTTAVTQQLIRLLTC